MPVGQASGKDLVILGAVLALCAVMWLATQGREAREGACVAAAALKRKIMISSTMLWKAILIFAPSSGRSRSKPAR